MPNSSPKIVLNVNPDFSILTQLTSSANKDTNGDSDASVKVITKTCYANLFARSVRWIPDLIPAQRLDQHLNEEEAYFFLSKWGSRIGALMCGLGALISFMTAFMMLSVLVNFPGTFFFSFSFGSLLLMMCLMMSLQRRLPNLKHIFSSERLPITLTYLGSMCAMLFCGIVLHSFVGTLIASVVQVMALKSYFFTYFPDGFACCGKTQRMDLPHATGHLYI